jgi:hypothetical protein
MRAIIAVLLAALYAETAGAGLIVVQNFPEPQSPLHTATQVSTTDWHTVYGPLPIVFQSWHIVSLAWPDNSFPPLDSVPVSITLYFGGHLVDGNTGALISEGWSGWLDYAGQLIHISPTSEDLEPVTFTDFPDPNNLPETATMWADVPEQTDTIGVLLAGRAFGSPIMTQHDCVTANHVPYADPRDAPLDDYHTDCQTNHSDFAGLAFTAVFESRVPEPSGMSLLCFLLLGWHRRFPCGH